MSIWGIRNTTIPHGELLGDGSTGFVSVGFDPTPDLQTCEASPEAFAEAVAQAYPRAGSAVVTDRADQLYCFVHAMAPGDVVIAPDPATRTLSFGRVAGPYYYESEAPEHRHRVAVRWRRTGVARSVFSRDLRDEIDSRSTFFQITRSAPEIEAFLSAPTQEAFAAHRREAQGPGADQGEDSSWDAQEAREPFPDAERIEQRTLDVIADRLVHGISRSEFTALVADLLQAMGYHTRPCYRPGEAAVDLLAHRDALGLEGPATKVRCLHTDIPAGRPEAQALLGAMSAGERGLLVALGSWTAQAAALEAESPGLRLLGGAEVTGLFAAHYDRLPPRWHALVPLRPVLALEADDAEAQGAQ
ncbi:restriction endonuclease [Actinomyces bowdenii]|uniref:Restriction endonuclease n=1 Tax=Actinomyces bowdenii TaxID=131109 RepID=A0A3P1V443_9ACTO|nr:restriction endonuclease [Actinomyces bowdenii]RRD28964.1 restriction endonuclease [Actinomyces bowdenii]